MDSGSTRAREKRWAVIAEDGRHSWLGRHSDPSPEEIARVEEHMAQSGQGAFLAIVEGDYWSLRGRLGFVMVKPLAAPQASFDAATAAFEAARRARLADLAG